jgi:hypothetical protein
LLNVDRRSEGGTQQDVVIHMIEDSEE